MVELSNNDELHAELVAVVNNLLDDVAVEIKQAIEKWL